MTKVETPQVVVGRPGIMKVIFFMSLWKFINIVSLGAVCMNIYEYLIILCR